MKIYYIPIREWPAFGLGLLIGALLMSLTACTTLTPQQQIGRDDAQAFIKAAAAAYRVWAPPLIVGEAPTATGCYYRSAAFFCGTAVLTRVTRDALLAHEFAHYLRGDGPILYSTPSWQSVSEAHEQAANVLSVDILMRAKGMTRDAAVALVTRRLSTMGWVEGHKTPGAELADFLEAFPISSPAALR